MAASGRQTEEKARQRKVTSRGIRPKARRATGSARFPNLASLVEAGGILGVAYQGGRYILSAVVPNDTSEPTSAVLTYDSLDDAIGEIEAFLARCLPQRLVDGAGGGRAKAPAKKKAGKAASRKPPKTTAKGPQKAATKGSQKAATKAGGKAPTAKRGASKASATKRKPGR